MPIRPFVAALASALLALTASSQTTWTVTLNANSFSPKNLIIAFGDTVQWVTPGPQLHDVTSGVGGVHDGNFGSGPAVIGPSTVLVHTFDSAFVSGHPMPNQTYPYYCEVHLPGMTGTVKVNVPAQLAPYGCGVNPAGSLQTIAGLPRPGQSFTLGAHNPLGTQGAGSLAFLALSLVSAPGYPCGLTLGGLGMSGGAGELLIDVSPGNLLSPVYGPQVWPGSAVNFTLNVPNNTSLIGLQLYVQGALLDPAPGALVPLGVTGGLRATIGT